MTDATIGEGVQPSAGTLVVPMGVEVGPTGADWLACRSERPFGRRNAR